jgi:hypothetical protein
MKTPPYIPPLSVDYHSISNLAIFTARKPALPDKRYTTAFAAMFQAGNTPLLPGKAELNMPVADKISGGEAENMNDRKLLRRRAFG